MANSKSNPQKLDVFSLFLPEIRELIEKRDFAVLKEVLRKINSIDTAEGWLLLSPQERLLVFKLLAPRKAVEVFEDLRFDEQSYLLKNLNNDEVSLILN